MLIQPIETTEVPLIGLLECTSKCSHHPGITFELSQSDMTIWSSCEVIGLSGSVHTTYFQLRCGCLLRTYREGRSSVYQNLRVRLKIIWRLPFSKKLLPTRSRVAFMTDWTPSASPSSSSVFMVACGSEELERVLTSSPLLSPESLEMFPPLGMNF